MDGLNNEIPPDLDVELEEGNDDIVITVPFNPAEIDIQIIPRNIGQLVEMLDDEEIMIPRYQRRPNLWSNAKKSRFIESLMLGLPIPLFYFDEAENKKWYVVDGLQRMSTLEHFILGKGNVGMNEEKFALEKLQFLTDYNGCTWDVLPKFIKKSINTSQVTINLIRKGTPDDVKYTIFSRINQGGDPLKPQEIRTALFQGYRVDFLETLVSRETEIGRLFQQVTANSIKSRRQEDLDFASRFIAFYIQGFASYEPDMDRFISTGTKLIPTRIDEQKNLVRNFEKSLKLSWELFGEDSFRKRVNENDGRRPINKSIFEVISSTFSKLEQSHINMLISHKREFKTNFIRFQNSNSKFWNAITTGTASKENVSNRHTEFISFLENFLHDKTISN